MIWCSRDRIVAPNTTLTIRELNRATLARQGLLKRTSKSAAEVVAQLACMQAQAASAPYVGLWSRIASFDRDELSRACLDRKIVKATLMRATLHLCTAADYPWMRGVVQSVLTAASVRIAKTRGAGDLDRDAFLAAAGPFLAERPRSYAELTQMLADRFPKVDAGAMRYAVRTHLPIVQVPNDSPWAYPGNATWTLAETWIGKTIPGTEKAADRTELVRRYLAAFGPASVRDFETWSGMAKSTELFESMRDELSIFRDESKRELFDVPGAPHPGAGADASPRFLPEFDNVLLAHQKRTRIVADEHRKSVFLPGLRVAPTLLIDGFVAGAWKVESSRRSAAIHITAFRPLPRAVKTAVVEEAERLVRFVAAEAGRYEVVVL